jgi:hypothetical protein
MEIRRIFSSWISEPNRTNSRITGFESNFRFSRESDCDDQCDRTIADSTPRILKYTAFAEDSVTTLAIKLLGSDTQEARNTIINNNPSLKRDPDRLIAGQTYSIPAPMAAVTNR